MGAWAISTCDCIVPLGSAWAWFCTCHFYLVMKCFCVCLIVWPHKSGNTQSTMSSSSHRARGSFSIRFNSKAWTASQKRTVIWKREHCFPSNPEYIPWSSSWGLPYNIPIYHRNIKCYRIYWFIRPCSIACTRLVYSLQPGLVVESSFTWSPLKTGCIMGYILNRSEQHKQMCHLLSPKYSGPPNGENCSWL